MKIQNFKLLCTALLCMNLIQSPVQAAIINGNTTIPNAITPTIATAAALFVGYNYLIREEHLVKNTHPDAQAWYDNLTEKYPDAHLSTKKFVQTPKGGFLSIPNYLSDFAKQCCWSSTYDHIYFSGESLKEISFLYKKMIQGYPLDEQEQLALARQEFILLYEAGHIEHSNTSNLLLKIAALGTAIFGAKAIHDKINIFNNHNSNNNQNSFAGYPNPIMNPRIFNRANPLRTPEIYGWNNPILAPEALVTLEGTAFIACVIALLRHESMKADEFACKNADTATLKGALTLFDNNGTDPLFDLENKEMTPYIATESSVGKAIQEIANPVEGYVNLALKEIGLQIKSNAVTRWMFDFTQNAAQAGPSVRAQTIKDEIARREEQQSEEQN